jgi:hypothetical protein
MTPTASDYETGFFPLADNTQTRQVRKGFICERDGRSIELSFHGLLIHFFATDLWDCPDGYFKIAEDCVKMFTERKTYLEAMDTCGNEGAKLALPETIPDVND